MHVGASCFFKGIYDTIFIIYTLKFSLEHNKNEQKFNL